MDRLESMSDTSNACPSLITSIEEANGVVGLLWSVGPDNAISAVNLRASRSRIRKVPTLT